MTSAEDTGRILAWLTRNQHSTVREIAAAAGLGSQYVSARLKGAVMAGRAAKDRDHGAAPWQWRAIAPRRTRLWTSPRTSPAAPGGPSKHNEGIPNPAWSTGERLAVALVLADDAYIATEGYTKAQALERLAGDIGGASVGAWLAYVRGVLEEEPCDEG